METYLEFRTRLRQRLWAGNEPYSLVASHDDYFQAAMIDIQRWVPCVQQNNTSIFPFCGTYWDDAKTAVGAPNGTVNRVYTVANDDWRDKVWYYSDRYEALECWGKRLYEVAEPANENLPSLPHGFKYAESIELPDGMSRARVGRWAIRRRRLYVAPFIQSNEKLVVEWDGIKHQWEDTDGVDNTWWTPDYEEAIKEYVMWKHEHFHGDRQLAVDHERGYKEKLSDLMWQCRENTRTQHVEPVCVEKIDNLTQEELDDDAIPEVDSTTDILFVADWGEDGEALDDVVEAMEGEGDTSLLILGGDNTYGGDFETLYAKWANFDTKRTIWGNHDWDADDDLDTLQAIVGEQGNNERYFRKVAGPVEFFFLSTDPREPNSGYVDATTSIENGQMMQWLKTYLALSTAYWKVVVGHHGPYMSDVNNTPGNQWLRCPYKTWGADLYLNGHGHSAEFVEVDGFPYVTCGIGGHSLRSFGANTSGTILKQYNSDYGYLKMAASCDELVLTLKNRSGEEVYDYTLTK